MYKIRLKTSATLKTLHGSTWRTTRVTRRTRGRRPSRRGTGATWWADIVEVTYGGSGGAIGALGAATSVPVRSAGGAAGWPDGIATGSAVGTTECSPLTGRRAFGSTRAPGG